MKKGEKQKNRESSARDKLAGQGRRLQLALKAQELLRKEGLADQDSARSLVDKALSRNNEGIAQDKAVPRKVRHKAVPVEPWIPDAGFGITPVVVRDRMNFPVQGFTGDPKQESSPRSIWIIERKRPTETEAGWRPVSGQLFIHKKNAELASRHQTKFWQYRAVEYTRKESK